MALGMIMIPMGFQFLAVLGGKALLLAKMALILTSIQGLKKIATSHVNYGLYSTAGHQGCKDGSFNLPSYDTLDCEGDDIFVSFDVEDLSNQGSNKDACKYSKSCPSFLYLFVKCCEQCKQYMFIYMFICFL